MFRDQKVGAIIVAAGSGERMGGIDKIFAPLGGVTVLEHTVQVFEKSPYIDFITVVLRKDNLEHGMSLLCPKNISKLTSICQGGMRRQDSTLAGLNALPQCQWVLVHDGARPLLDQGIILDGLEAAQETGAAAAAVPVTDTIKRTDEDGCVKETLQRQSLWAAQTPQVFRFDLIEAGFRHATDSVTDDVALVEALGIRVKLFNGSYDNIKLTTPTDLVLAQALCQQKGN
ncbi:MAG: 2-C-methyl-D-erythritol 4-phosphate cytidylyltransferase [Dehalococcoidia bacterium]|nr:2-C-methyl-D-erythritol 4-phosphate cytidylyltransferase [Dehalococcoidia bacterium]